MKKRAAYKGPEWEIFSVDPDTHRMPDESVVPLQTTASLADAALVADTVLIKGRPAAKATCTQAPASTVHGSSGGVLSGTDGGPSLIVEGCETVLVEGAPAGHDGSAALVNDANTDGMVMYLPGGAAPEPPAMDMALDFTPSGPAAPPIPLQTDMTLRATGVPDAATPPALALATPAPGCDPPPLVIPPWDPSDRQRALAQAGMVSTPPIGDTAVIGQLPAPSGPASPSEEGLWRAAGGAVGMAFSAAGVAFGGPLSPAAGAGFVYNLDQAWTGYQQWSTNQPVATLPYQLGSGWAQMFGASPEEQDQLGRGLELVAPLVDLVPVKAAAPRVAKGVFIEADGVADVAQLEARAMNKCAAGKCVLTGHPVDVATGRVLTSREDLRLDGPVPVVLKRDYSSAWTGRDSALGFGWSHSYDQAVWVEGSRVVYRAGDGREIEIDWPEGQPMAAGAEVFERRERLTLRAVGRGGWEVWTAEGVCHSFAPVHAGPEGIARLTAIRVPTGLSLGFEYDGAGRLVKIRDAVGRMVCLEYNESGKLARALSPHPAEEGWVLHTSYVYSPEGDLIEARDALEQAIRYRYEGHLLVQETDRAGLSFYFEYEPGGRGPQSRCLRTWGDGGLFRRELEYHATRRITRVTDSLGETTEYRFDEALSPVLVMDPRGAITRALYDKDGRFTEIIDAAGDTMRFEHDERGNCVRRTWPDGTCEQVVYDAANRPREAIRRGGGVIRSRYDERGCLVERVDPLGARTRYRYDDRGLLAAIEHPGGGRTTFTRDAHGNVTTYRLPNGYETRFEHDRLSRITAMRGPGQRRAVRFRHDRCGRRSGIEDASGRRSVRFRFDGEGNVIEKLDGEGKSLERTSYTGLHRLASWERAGRAALRIHYDTEDRVTAIEDGAGHVHRYVRDARGQVVEEQTFDGRRIRHAYDLAGNHVKTIQPGGGVVEHRYDARARSIETSYSDGTWTRLTYHPDGGLASAVNSTTEVHFEHDAAGNVVAERQGPHRVWSRHAAGGRRVEIRSTAGAHITIGRDVLGDPTEVRAGAAGARRWTFQRDLDRAEVGRGLPGNVRVEWSRGDDGAPAQRRLLRRDDVLASRTYTWSNDRMVGVEDSSGASAAYTYEEDGSIGARYDKGRQSLLARDPAGYAYRTADGSDRRYGRGGRLLAAEQVHLVHDDDGQIRQKILPDGRSWRYAFDAAGQLTEVVRPDGERVSFAYDALGRRVRKQAAGVTTTWVWDRDTVLHEQRDGRPPVTWLFCPDSQEVLAKLEGAAGERCYSAVTDEIGTSDTLVDEAGALAWQMQLDLYGVPRDRPEAQATEHPWRWQGQYEDEETGLHYNRFRYYDPETGRYISPDPIGLLGGPDLYGYVPNPLTHVDPFGLQQCRPTLALSRFGAGSGEMDEFVAATGAKDIWDWSLESAVNAHAAGDNDLVKLLLERDWADRVRYAINDPNQHIVFNLTSLKGRHLELMKMTPEELWAAREFTAWELKQITLTPGIQDRVTFYIYHEGKFKQIPFRVGPR